MSDNIPPIQAYIENAHDDSIGGFTIPLPTTKETLQPWLAAIKADGFQEPDIAIRRVKSSMPWLDKVFRSLNEGDTTFDELNYLAVKINEMNPHARDVLTAAAEAGWDCKTVRDLINMSENLSDFDLQPAFSEEQYGDFLVNMACRDEHAGVFNRLARSEDPAERALAAYIERLEAHIDFEAFGRDAAKEENGRFTKRGYLTGGSDFQEVYRGPEDIPDGYRIFTAPEPLLMAADVDLPVFLTELHATAGDYIRDAEHTLEVLSRLRSAEYLLLMDGGGAYLTESMHAYRQGTDAFNRWAHAEGTPDTKAFAIHITEVHGRIAGDVAQIDVARRQRDILEHSIKPIRMEATLKNGSRQTHTPEEWDALDPLENDNIREWRREFQDGDHAKVSRHLEALRDKDDASCKPVAAGEFLTYVNAAYMDQALYPQPDMLRVSQTAAKEMLARGDANVYRLLPEGPEKLSPMDAVKCGLWFSVHREFAIKREDAGGLAKWAERNAGDMRSRLREHGEQNQQHGPEL